MRNPSGFETAMFVLLGVILNLVLSPLGIVAMMVGGFGVAGLAAFALYPLRSVVSA